MCPEALDELIFHRRISKLQSSLQARIPNSGSKRECSRDPAAVEAEEEIQRFLSQVRSAWGIENIGKNE